MRVRMRGINTVHKRLADGSTATYHYHRATGTRLKGEPGSAEFHASFAAAESRKIEHPGNTLGALIDQFQGSGEWDALADSSRREYRRIFAVIGTEFGSVPLEGLEMRSFRADVLAWRDRHAKKAPREADYRITALARVLSWAQDRGILATNILANIKRVYKSDRSEKIWLPEHIAAFMAAAPIELQRCLMLALHTGQRQGDLLRLTWNAYDGQALSLRQGKTGARVIVPCTRPLKVMLDGMRGDKVVSLAGSILTTSSGSPWKAKHLQHKWAATMERAGIVGLHFHDLRGTFVTMLSEAGCTEQEVASITGHALQGAQVLDKYLARTRELAENAIRKLDQYIDANQKRAAG